MPATVNCPYCQTPITAATPTGVCPKCRTPHHMACWQQNGGCATTGCALPVASLGAPVFPPAPRFTGRNDYVIARNSGLAIAAFILSLLGFITFGIAALLALILGIVAVVQINKSQGQLIGKGFAITGIVIGSCISVWVAIFFPVFAKAREKACETTCLSNQQHLCTAIQMFAQDHHGSFPANLDMCIMGQNAKLLHCPSTPSQLLLGYGVNCKLCNRLFADIENPATLLCTADCNETSCFLNTESDIDCTRHHKGFNASFVDGHVQFMKTVPLLTTGMLPPNSGGKRSTIIPQFPVPNFYLNGGENFSGYVALFM
jgi:prepilin-type processing-associated H-X9-DG protein